MNKTNVVHPQKQEKNSAAHQVWGKVRTHVIDAKLGFQSRHNKFVHFDVFAIELQPC